MALFEWKNGTKVQNAVVTSDGTTVQDAVWEGETPISANNMNQAQKKMQDEYNGLIGELNELNTTDKGNIVNAINEIYNAIYGEDWKNATFSSNFTGYSTGSSVKYKKTGKVVQVLGQVKTTKTLNKGTICTLPVGYRPSMEVYNIAQGSGVNKWLVIARSDGSIELDRYGTSTQIDVNTSQWLAFSIVFIADN